MTVSARPQISIYEQTIEDPELEAALERREVLKAAASEARKSLTEATDSIKTTVKALDVADAPVRVGRFVISQRRIAAKSVSFETAPTERLSIRLLPEDD